MKNGRYMSQCTKPTINQILFSAYRGAHRTCALIRSAKMLHSEQIFCPQFCELMLQVESNVEGSESTERWS
jgi:hypothetical protein